LNLLFYDSLAGSYLAELTPKALSRNQFLILKILHKEGPLLVCKIADMMKISHAAASKNIDMLVKNDFVARETLTGDRRKTIVSLLKSGEKIIQKFEVKLSAKWNGINETLTKKEMETLLQLLSKYVHGYLGQEEKLDFICANCTGIESNECPLLVHNVKCRFSGSALERL
jgi:DNA-binding MarR family transcriptional regulator